MKKSQALAGLALIMALGLAAPAILSASAEEGQSEESSSSANNSAGIERVAPDGNVTATSLDDAEGDNVNVQTDNTEIPVSAANDLAELQAALASTAETITVTSTINITENTTLDLSGKTLKLADGLTRMFYVQSGTLEITGNGTLSSNDSEDQTGDALLWITGSATSIDNHATLTVGSYVKVYSSNSYGLAVHYLSADNPEHNSYGVTVNFSGTIEAPYGISVNGNIQHTENAPAMNLDGATVTSTASDLAIFAAGYANWNLTDTTLTGATPLGIKAGTFVLDGATLTANGKYVSIGATGSGMNPNGSTIQIENSQPYAGAGIDIEIKSGTYKSTNGPVFSEYGTVSEAVRTVGSRLQRLAIAGGTFQSAEDQPIFEGVVTNETVITGGTFNNDEGLEDYLKDNQTLVKDENGNFTIQTTSTSTDPEDPSDDPEEENKPVTKPDADKKPGGSSPNTGVLGTIEQAANAIGAIGTTIITGVFVASGALLAWIIGSRRNRAAAKSSSRTSKTSKSAKNGRNFQLDRIEVEISTTPKKAASSRAAKTVSKSAKSVKTAAKTTKKVAAASVKSSSRASQSPKSASSRKTATTASKTSKSAKTAAKSSRKR